MSNPHSSRTRPVAVLFVGFFSTLIFHGCSTVSTLNLIDSPSNLILVRVHPYSKAPVSYSVASNVPHPYVSRYMLGLTNIFPVSSSFRRCTEAYMQTKFGRIVPADSAESSYLFKFKLDSFSFVYKDVWSNPILKASLWSTVTVIRGDSIVGSKAILATARTMGQAWEDGPNTALTDEAMNRTFIMIEKYLYSIGF